MENMSIKLEVTTPVNDILLIGFFSSGYIFTYFHFIVSCKYFVQFTEKYNHCKNSPIHSTYKVIITLLSDIQCELFLSSRVLGYLSQWYTDTIFTPTLLSIFSANLFYL